MTKQNRDAQLHSIYAVGGKTRRNSRTRQERLTMLSAFTGAGGLDLGLERAGFVSIGCIEKDPYARETITLNGVGPLLHEGDVCAASRKISPSDFGLKPRELALLCGAPPCQPFSKAAQWARTGRAGLADPRSECITAFLRIAATFLPAAVLIENVPGFASGEHSALPRIKASFERINRRHKTAYTVSLACLNAADYGVPQRRKRVFVVALRNGDPFSWPTTTHSNEPVTAWDAIGHIRPQDVPVARGKWAALLPSIPEGGNYLHHTPRGSGRPLFGERTRFWTFLLKLAKDQPAWTLSAQPGPSTGPFHWSGRPLAIEEALRLQSFPHTWRVAGPVREQIRLIGNATPPLLAEVIGRTIAQTLTGRRWRKSPSLSIGRAPSTPPADPPKKASKIFSKFEAAHPAHPGPGKGPSPRDQAPNAAV